MVEAIPNALSFISATCAMPRCGWLGPQKGKPLFIELDSTHDQVGVMREHEPVGPNADNLALVEHPGQDATEVAAFGGIQAELFG